MREGGREGSGVAESLVLRLRYITPIEAEGGRPEKMKERREEETELGENRCSEKEMLREKVNYGQEQRKEKVG